MTKEQIAAIAQKYANEVYPGGYTEYTAILLAIGEALEQASQPHEIHNQSLEKVGRIMESMKYADEDGGYNGAVKDLCTIVEKAKRN